MTYRLPKYPIKVQIFRLSTAQVKIYHVICQIKSQLFFSFLRSFFSVMKEFFCTFLAETLYAIANFQTCLYPIANFQTRIKIHQSPHVIFGTKSKFFLNLASLFSAMGHNSSVHFHLNLCMPWTKEYDLSTDVQTFEFSHKN